MLMKYKDFKEMTQDEMKSVKGGYETFHPAMVYCNDGAKIPSTNECSNSVGVCNAHGGFDYCEGSYYS